MKRLMLYTAVALATLGLIFILWQFRLIVLLFVLSLFTAAAIRPIVGALGTRGVPSAAGILLVYLVGVGGLLILLFLIGDRLLVEINVAVNRLVVEYEGLYNRWLAGAGWQQYAASNLLPPAFSLGAEEEVNWEALLPAILNITAGLTSAIGGLLIVISLSVYWSVDQNRFERLWLSLLPVSRRMLARDSWREIEGKIGNYLRSQFAQSMIAAFFLLVGGLLAGIDFPFLLAIFGGLAAFVPYLGGLVAVFAAFAAGASQNFALGMAAAAYTAVLFWILESRVRTRFQPREGRTSLLTLLLVIPLLETFGFWGLIAAPPLALAVEVFIRQAYGAALTRRKAEVQLDELELRGRLLREKIESVDSERLAPELRSLSDRLAALLDASGRELHT